jgi:hypothetical protein
MKYQKIAIWRAFLLKRNVFSHLLRRTRPCTCQTHTHLHGRTSRDRPTHQRPSHTQTPNRTPHRGKNDSDSLRSSSARGGLPLSSAVRALKLAPLLGCAGVGRPCLFLRQHADAGLTSSRGGARMSTLFSCGDTRGCQPRLSREDRPFLPAPPLLRRRPQRPSPLLRWHMQRPSPPLQRQIGPWCRWIGARRGRMKPQCRRIEGRGHQSYHYARRGRPLLSGSGSRPGRHSAHRLPRPCASPRASSESGN